MPRFSGLEQMFLDIPRRPCGAVRAFPKCERCRYARSVSRERRRDLARRVVGILDAQLWQSSGRAAGKTASLCPPDRVVETVVTPKDLSRHNKGRGTEDVQPPCFVGDGPVSLLVRGRAGGRKHAIGV